jgi:HEAT repeat protein
VDRLKLIMLALLVGLWAPAAFGQALVPDGVGPRYVTSEATYADAELLAAMAALLGDRDPITREQAVVALGEANNPAAVAMLAKASRDESPGVRAAAMTALAAYSSPEARAVVMAGLEDESQAVKLAAMRQMRRLQLTDAVKPLGKHAAEGQPSVRAAALETLTQLEATAPADVLASALDSDSRLQFRALENMLVNGSIPAAVLPKVRKLADDSSPALRGTAVELLAAQAGAASAEVLNSAAMSDEPMVRAGAARAAGRAGLAPLARGLLEDESPLVRLAAVKAVGDLRDSPSIDPLIAILQNAPQLQTHLAARQSLRQIGGETVAKRAAAVLTSIHGHPIAEGSKGQLQRRSLQSAAWLLGELKSTEALATMNNMLTSLPIDSPVVREVALAVGKIGDERSVQPLLALLAKCQQIAPAYLRSLNSPNDPPPFSESVIVACLESLAALKAAQLLPPAIAMTKMQSGQARLSLVAAATARLLPEFAKPDDRGIEALVSDLVVGEGFDLYVHVNGAEAAGKLKLDSTLPALRKLLQEMRPGLEVMTRAADAIEAITGDRPDIPAPRLNQGASWVIRKTREM